MTKMRCLICGNEIPEKENECPICIAILNFLTFHHLDEINLPKLKRIPNLITHIYEIIKMDYEALCNNLDSLSKKGFELIKQEKDKEVKNMAKNFFQGFMDFMTSREARADYGRESIDESGIEILKKFIDSELDIIIEMNNQKINEANELIKQNMHIKAAELLKIHAKYLKKIGKEEIGDQILSKSLDLLLEGFEFEEFFLIFKELSKNIKSKYLIRIFPKYLQKLEEIKELVDYKRSELIFENSISIYREQMLYDQSKEINAIFIKD